MSARRGKIARLPREKRELVNRMLLDGATFEQIKEALGEDGKDLIDQNLTNWRQGGYQDWLREQERLEEMRLKREFALRVVQENEGSLVHEAGMQIAAAQIYEILNEFDLSKLKEEIQADPANFSRLINALAKLSDTGLKYERYRAEVKAAKERMLAEIGEGKRRGITTETIERIERELRLL
jgi:hypothetical protein